VNDKIIKFPGLSTNPRPPKPPKNPGVAHADPGDETDALPTLPAIPAKPDPAHPEEVTLLLTARQQKAVQIIASGMAFVIVGIKPDATGASFHTSLHGDHTDLRNAKDHLLEVIARLYEREGVR
jgi:hypothetical protein